MASERILVVEDTPSVAKLVATHLEAAGYHAEIALSGPEALQRLATGPLPDLILIDIMMPGMDGFELTSRIRSDPRTAQLPIIMLTARDAVEDKVRGFEAGADDYVTKPFSLRELVARVRAALRRPHLEAPMGPRSPKRLCSGRIEVDLDRQEVWVEGKQVDLPRKEYELLRVLLTQRGRTVTRENLLDWVWGDAFMGDFKTLDVHIRRLREKIETDPSRPQYVLTVRGVGYKWGGP